MIDGVIATLLNEAQAAGLAFFAEQRARGVTPDTKILKAYIAAHSIVLGVFRDEQSRPDCYLIKGQAALEAIIARGEAQTLRFGAIHCRSLEEAVAMSHVYGDVKQANLSMK